MHSRLLRRGLRLAVHVFEYLRRAALQQCLANLSRPRPPDRFRLLLRAKPLTRRAAPRRRSSAIAPSCTSAKAPIGTWQPPPSLFSSARSQVVAARDCGVVQERKVLAHLSIALANLDAQAPPVRRPDT